MANKKRIVKKKNVLIYISYLLASKKVLHIVLNILSKIRCGEGAPEGGLRGSRRPRRQQVTF